MKLFFPKTATTLHMSREDAAPFLAAGMAEEVIEPKVGEPELTWRVGEGTVSGEPILCWTANGPGQNFSGAARGWHAAREVQVWFQGKLYTPPLHLLDELRNMRPHIRHLSEGQQMSEGITPAGHFVQDRDLEFTQSPFPVRDPQAGPEATRLLAEQGKVFTPGIGITKAN